MCRTWTIHYGCGHFCAFRLSTCHGHYTVQTKHHLTKVSCTGDACHVFQATSFCGPCSRTEAEEQIKEEYEKLSLRLKMRAQRASHDLALGPSQDMVNAESDFAAKLWALGKLFPDARRKKMLRPEKGLASTRSGSLLRREVRAEDVVVKAPSSRANGWADAEEGWASLSDELAADRDATPQDLPSSDDANNSDDESSTQDEDDNSIEAWLAAAAATERAEAEQKSPSVVTEAQLDPEETDTDTVVAAVPPVLPSPPTTPEEMGKPIPPRRKPCLTASIRAKDRPPSAGVVQYVELTVR